MKDKEEIALEILNEMPSTKIGLDDFYGRQTVLKAINQALNTQSVSNSVICGNCKGYGYTIDENGRRKESCKDCQ